MVLVIRCTVYAIRYTVAEHTGHGERPGCTGRAASWTHAPSAATDASRLLDLQHAYKSVVYEQIDQRCISRVQSRAGPGRDGPGREGRELRCCENGARTANANAKAHAPCNMKRTVEALSEARRFQHGANALRFPASKALAKHSTPRHRTPLSENWAASLSQVRRTRESRCNMHRSHCKRPASLDRRPRRAHSKAPADADPMH